MASRQGVSGKAENADLEARLIKMESKASGISTSSAPADTSVNSPSTVPNIAAPPIVGGISIQNRIPGAVSVKWAPLDISIIDRYDVWVSSDTNFPPELTFKYQVSEKANSFTFTEGNPDTTYYIAIRGVAGSGRIGPWSSYVNSKTGKATKFIVDRGAFSTIDTQAEIFADPLGANPHIATNMGALVIDVKIPGTILFFGKVDLVPSDNFRETGGSWTPPGHNFDISIGMAASSGPVTVTRVNHRNSMFGAGMFLYLETIFIQDMFYLPSPGLYTFGMIISEPCPIGNYKISVVQLVNAGKPSG